MPKNVATNLHSSLISFHTYNDLRERVSYTVDNLFPSNPQERPFLDSGSIAGLLNTTAFGLDTPEFCSILTCTFLSMLGGIRDLLTMGVLPCAIGRCCGFTAFSRWIWALSATIESMLKVDISEPMAREPMVMASHL